MGFNITGNPAADALLDRDPFALLVAMLLDQQFPMEKAFAGPALLAERLETDHLDPLAIAQADPEAVYSLFLHDAANRFKPGGRLREEYPDVAARLGHEAHRLAHDSPSAWRDGADLLASLKLGS